MALIVKKFGGTSVSTKERRQQVLKKIMDEKNAGNDVVVVVSAMGRRGDPYATDTFLDMLSDVSPRPSARTKDLLAGCGEVIATCLVAEDLSACGYPAIPITGLQAGIHTDDHFTDGIVQDVDASYIKEVIAGGSVAVVTGFQGYSDKMDLVTLGRGGSDITAIVLGGALEADGVEIYTDVPGIAFTDPRLVPSAPFLSSIDFSPMYVLAMTGAKVVHPRAVSAAIKFDRPFWVRSTFDDEPGTLVGKKGEAPGGLYGISLMSDMILAQAARDPEQRLRAASCNTWFYKADTGGSAAIVEPGKAEELKELCRLEDVGVVSLQWDPDSGLHPELVAEALDALHIRWEGYFALPDGGAWAIAPDKAKDAVLALFRAPLQKS
ncbi:MAG: hypothetical protein FWH49_01155 [Clostridiales bacterium]|nr:hypothetical protein [Clostridiales bacterium]